MKPLHQTLSPSQVVFLTISLMVGVFMAILDTTIVDIVVPKMMAPLSTDLYGIQWVITSYMTSAATAIMLVEWLETKVGLKKIFLSGIFLFTASSFFAGNAQNLEWMITARVFQGFGESLIVVSAEAMLFSAYAPEKRGLAMGIYGLGVSFAPAIGPTLGGWLTEHIDWRWIFYINIPIGILNFIGALFFLPDYKPAHRFPLNFLSFFFLSVGTVSLLIVLSKGQQKGWFSSEMIGYLTFLSVGSFLLFALSELLSKNKLIDYSIFRIREFVVAFWVYCFVLGFSMYQVFYLLPLYFEKLKGISTLQTGIYILPLAISIGLFSPIAGLISDKKSSVLPLVIASGLYLYFVFFILSDFNYYTSSLKASMLLIILGIGMGFFFAPITNLALKNLGEKTTLGVSLMHYIRFVGGSFGTALATNDLQRFFAESYERMTELQDLERAHFLVELMQEWGYMSEEKALHSLQSIQTLYALSDSFEKTFLWTGFWALIGVIPIFFLLYKKPKVLHS
ncbi:DHA2 family efflux MFS transporter permease subunit [Thermocrinis sp.]